MRKEIRGAGILQEEVFRFDTDEEAMDHAVHNWYLARTAGSDFEVGVAMIENWLAEHKYLNVIDPNHVEQLRFHIKVARDLINAKLPSSAARKGILIGELFATIKIATQWQKLTLRGKAVAEGKRGPSRLYREARDVLIAKGMKLSAKVVRRELEIKKVTCEKNDVLHWTDDRGTKRKTTVRQFADRLTSLRSAPS